MCVFIIVYFGVIEQLLYLECPRGLRPSLCTCISLVFVIR